MDVKNIKRPAWLAKDASAIVIEPDYERGELAIKVYTTMPAPGEFPAPDTEAALAGARIAIATYHRRLAEEAMLADTEAEGEPADEPCASCGEVHEHPRWSACPGCGRPMVTTPEGQPAQGCPCGFVLN
jgi:hypothetical protein